ncbi:MAG: 50S ribosome-binding GTPase, partial [Clostridia bacterium]|nr:50S ribosome-binding GTPase [Clostridia bacterium]
MSRAVRVIQRVLPALDAVLEVADARLPATSRNPGLAKLCGDRPRILVLARADLADPEATRAWLDFLRPVEVVVAVDAAGGRGVGRLPPLIRSLAAQQPQWYPHDPRVLIAGIPNVGKSSLLNRLSGGARARTGARPGVTRGPQWVRGNGLEILDTPGILPPHLPGAEATALLAAVGCLADALYDPLEAAAFVVERLRTLYPGRLAAACGLGGEDGPPSSVLEALARRRGYRRAGEPDVERSARVLLQ